MRNVIRRAWRLLVPASVRERLWRYRAPRVLFRQWRYEHFYRGGVVKRAGRTYRLHCREEISRSVFVHGSYGDAELRLLVRAAPHFQSFIDCGANIGTITVPFVRATNLPTLAIEPVGTNARLLRENVLSNGLSARVEVCQIAVGDVRGIQNMYLSEDNKGDNRLWLSSQEGRPSEQVEVVPLDEIVARSSSIRPPTLVKMDIQGFEFKALLGASRFLREPCLLLVEFWPEGLAAAGCELRDYEALLASRNMSIFELERGRLKTVSSLQNLAPKFVGDNFCDLVITNLDLAETGLAELLEEVPAGGPVIR